MVKGKLEFEPRLELKNFEKRLPKDDTLARAVGLEKSKKGARLLIEPCLANKLLADCPNWLASDGYVRERYPTQSIRQDSILRRIAPCPEQDCYECLYWWICDDTLSHHGVDYKAKGEELKAIRAMLADDLVEHYDETISLLQRCKARQALQAD